MADLGKHFCTCGDTRCPCNPNNPANLAKGGFGCDACIRKNLGDTEGWDDWSAEGFARFVKLHPRSDEVRRDTAARAKAFDEAHKA